MHSPRIFSLTYASSLEPCPRAEKGVREVESYSCLSEEGLSLSISRRRGGERGVQADESRARRAAIYTKSVGIPDRWPRQNAFARLARMGARARQREPVVAPFTKKLARGEERSHVASGDEHRHLRHSEIAIFAPRGREMDFFVRSTYD